MSARSVPASATADSTENTADLFPQTPADERTSLLARLWDEFYRLNALHFGGALRLDTLVVSTRKLYGGYCIPSQRKIVVSWQAYLDHGWDETLITFRHEVAHLVHPDHSPAFWALAETLGCPPHRRKALPPKNPLRAGIRFVYECPACKTRVYRRKRLLRASCGRCDSRFNSAYLLKTVKV